MPEVKEKAPAANEGLSDHQGAGSTSILADRPAHPTAKYADEYGPFLPANAVRTDNFCKDLDRHLLFATPLAELTDQGRANAWEFYRLGSIQGLEQGRAEGYREGYQAAEADMAALQRHAVSVVRSHEPSYPVLARRRGDYARADAAEARARKLGYFV